MNNPVISFFGPGIRTENWLRFYKSIADSCPVPFDLTIIGNREPTFDLPENLHHIQSWVKPAQCAEIGFRSSKGELVCPVADDEIFAKDSIESVYKLYKSLNNKKTFISFRYVLKGQDLASDVFSANRFNVRDPNSSLAPLCPFMSRDLWKETGGIDRRFIALYWDLDLSKRLEELGGQGILSPDACVEETGNSPFGGSHKLYDRYGPPYDRRVLDSFWMLNGQEQKKRLAPVEPFEDKDILIISQGPKGEWY